MLKREQAWVRERCRAFKPCVRSCVAVALSAGYPGALQKITANVQPALCSGTLIADSVASLAHSSNAAAFRSSAIWLLVLHAGGSDGSALHG